MSRSAFWRTAVVTVAVVLAGCGQGDPAKPGTADAGKLVVAVDAPGGFKLAVPESWVRQDFPAGSPERRRFSSAWGPPNVTLPAEGLFTQVMAPGCAAGDFGAKFPGQRLATTREAKGYSVVASGPATVGSRAVFRLEAKYGSELGDLCEVSMYVETGPGSGVYIVSRAPAGSEALAKARLDGAVAAFDSMARDVKPGAPSARGSGLEFGVPAGFEEFFGSTVPPATAGYWVGASPDGTAQEVITLMMVPSGPSEAEYLKNAMNAASRGFKKGAEKKVPLKKGGDMETVSYTPEKEDAPRLEIAIGMAKTRDTLSMIIVFAGMAPAGRAATILEGIAGSMTVSDVKPQKMEPRVFGSSRMRSVALPAGWEIKESPDGVQAMVTEKLKGIPAGQPDTRTRQFIEVQFASDSFGDDTPLTRANYLKRIVNEKKAIALPVEPFVLPDGRQGARLVVLAPGSTDVILMARVSAGAIAQVRVSSMAELGPETAMIANAALASCKLLTLSEQAAPDEAAAKAGREVLTRVVERGRTGRAAESWSVRKMVAGETKVETDLSASHLVTRPDGTWTETLRSPDRDPKKRQADRVTVLTTQEGSPGKMVETIDLAGALDPGMKRTKAKYSTTIDATAGAFVNIQRTPEGGETRQDRIPLTDLFLPPDVASSDGVLVGLAAEPDGVYVFQVVAEGTLGTFYRSYTVKAVEEVDTGLGKIKARRIEVLGRGTSWVEGGRVVRMESGPIIRVVCDQATAEKLLKD